MTYESRGALASHQEPRDNLLIRCYCGTLFETSPYKPAVECRDCMLHRQRAEKTQQLREEREEQEYASRVYVLEYDSSAYPMSKGYRLSQDEVDAMLRLGTFALGTRLRKRGQVMVVTEAGLISR